jgi:hypothetical protein
MTSTRQLFSSLKRQDLGVQVELGDDAKYAVVRVGTIPFQLELGNSLDFDDVLFVPGLTKNLVSVSVMEDNDFAIEFKNHQVLIRSKDFILNTTQVIGIREGNLYRLQGAMFEPWCITMRTYASCGTRGWGTCITRRCLFRGR